MTLASNPCTLYDDLEVSPLASAPVIKAAYRCLVQMHHPDKNPGDAAAAERLVRVNHAYAVLGDALARASYDARLGVQRTAIERRGSASRAMPLHSASGTRRFAFRPLG